MKGPELVQVAAIGCENHLDVDPLDRGNMRSLEDDLYYASTVSKFSLAQFGDTEKMPFARCSYLADL
jgi:hypothetical protein